MLPDISDIKKRRKRLGIKQRELSKLAGVSQSFVAKLESGKINPSYQNMRQIIKVLEMKEHEDQVSAKDIMVREVIHVHKDEMVSKAIKLMKKHGISQVPVMDNGKTIGSITDKDLLEKMGDEKSIKNLPNEKISNIMEDAFPQITEDTPLTSITALLKHEQALLVTKMGKIMGIITKADLLRG